MAGVVLLFGMGLGWGGAVSAQSVTNAAEPAARVTPPTPSSLLLLAPGGKSPVAVFRELLAMNFFERRLSLTNRPPAVRKQILAKLREYETLKPDERELRLKVTELHWYLYPLMASSPSNRAELLSRVPAADRQLVEDRLKEWDKLSPDAQKELLKYEQAIPYLHDPRGGTNQPAPPKYLEKKVQQWAALPEEQRQKMMERFTQYFTLTSAEQGRVLRSLSDPERRQIERTLDKFSQLNPVQRARCLQSFEKFASLSPVERQEFLKNAERWTLMTPAERQEWRDLVSKAPSLNGKPFHPPLPPVRRARASGTNNGG